MHGALIPVTPYLYLIRQRNDGTARKELSESIMMSIVVSTQHSTASVYSVHSVHGPHLQKLTQRN